MRVLILFITLFLSFSSFANLLLVGGGKRPVEAMEKFVQSSGASKSRILIIPWASGTLESSEKIKIELEELSAGSFRIAPFSLTDKNISQFKRELIQSTGIFFVGGDQNKLMEVILKNNLKSIFRSLFSSKITFGGTSAGTAIMSDPMLTGESDLGTLNSQSTELSQGLGLLSHGIIVDQHFVKRARFNRLAGLILDGKADIGIGIDEDSALWIEGSQMQAFGDGPVVFIKKKSKGTLVLKVLKAGESLLLPQNEFFTFPLEN